MHIVYLGNKLGGSPSLGYDLRDVYNKLSQFKDRTFDGGDKLKFLIDVWSTRLISFLYLSLMLIIVWWVFFGMISRCWISILFWRLDYFWYNISNKQVWHDVCTICWDESSFKECYVWLFKTFLKSMGGKHSITVMTYQAFSMASVIKVVFPLTRHRLCCWHIIENSRKNIGGLRLSEGFTKIFNRALMECDTVDEFQHFWERYANDEISI